MITKDIKLNGLQLYISEPVPSRCSLRCLYDDLRAVRAVSTREIFRDCHPPQNYWNPRKVKFEPFVGILGINNVPLMLYCD